MKHTLSSKQLKLLCDTAIQAAQEAGQWIEGFDRNHLKTHFKSSGSSDASQIVTEVDIRSEEIIRHRLQHTSKQLNIAFVGEESALSTANDTNERFEKPYFWCVDPLDGTLAFTEGRSGYAVSIALVEQSGKPLIGVVYDPAQKTLTYAIKGQGKVRNPTSSEQTKDTTNSLIVYADASFNTHEKYESTLKAIENCAQTLCLNDVTFVYGNGAVKNACYVINANQACYLKLPKKEEGGGSIWDYAATTCIAHEAGAWASNIHGQSLELNRRDSTFMNHEGIIFASNSRIAKHLINTL